MVRPKIYVEGGGNNSSLHRECRHAFSVFLEKAGLGGRMPSIVACGSRHDAYDRFCIAIKQGQSAFLLVDSEAPVKKQHAASKYPEEWKPWAHLQEQDNWEKPENAADTDCHLMVEVMENWFLADKAALSAFLGKEFNANMLPARSDIEYISKTDIFNDLKKVFRNCRKNSYKKGEHSFKILKSLNPDKVAAASPWTKRFINTLRSKLK